MTLYKNIYIFFIIMCTSCTTLLQSSCKQKNSNTLSRNNNIKRTIIIDLPNVLFKENHLEFAKIIGYGTLASYAITHWKSPGYRFLDMLNAISQLSSQKPTISLTLKDRTLPQCIVELQKGTTDCSQAKLELKNCMECLSKTNFFKSDKEKQLMTSMMNLILDPQKLAAIMEPVKQTTQLIEKLKKAGHQIILFANVPTELFDALKTIHSDTLKIFDHIIVSSNIKTVKPEDDAFKHLLSTHNLKPHNCILIDDLETTIKAAEKLGINGIIHGKISHVTTKLRNLGVSV